MKPASQINSRGLAAIIAAGLLLFPALAGASDYKGISSQIARRARENAVGRIAVLEFAAKNGAGRHEAAYAAEKITAALSGQASPALVERALLQKILSERRLAAGAGAAGGGDALFLVDAVVSGAVFAYGERLKVMARLIEVRTGKVLFAAETETDRLPRDGWDAAFSEMDLPEVPMPSFSSWGGASAARPSDMRDAVADRKTGSCSERRRELEKGNREFVDMKARFWALKMRQPGFSSRRLSRNPGSEIADREIKGEFYRLLSDYARQAGSPYLSAAEAAEVARFLETEKKVLDDCGLI